MYLYCQAAGVFGFNQLISFLLQLVDLFLMCQQAISFEFLYINRKSIKRDVQNMKIFQALKSGSPRSSCVLCNQPLEDHA